MSKIIISLLCIGWFTSTAFAQKCNCPVSVKYVLEKIKLDYAGYSTKVNSLTEAGFNRFADSLQLASETAPGADSCYLLLKKLTNYFKDGHLRVQFDWRYRQKYPDKMKDLYKKTALPAVKASYVVHNTLSLKKLNKQTYIFAIPSFEAQYQHAIDSMISANRTNLLKAKNLIIDLRGNAGGVDYTYTSLLPFVYTRPVIQNGYEILASADAIENYKDNIKDTSISAGLKTYFTNTVNIMEKTKGQFVSPSGNRIDTLTLKEFHKLPLKVAVLVNRECKSSAETFLLFAKQSSKATVFGENTGGVIDYLESIFVDIPAFENLQLIVATKRSTRLPNYPLDNVGIPPDVRIPLTADPIMFISEYLINNK